ncbi:acyltransferase family protein [Cellulomonas timonensis]|uniref:acyltransferase family protein n=1 Tax=Cellulomonas timonensis TaxID=1689271 RepID=UPI00082EA130|nr:acyltransferase [Cellulomonas timonensis]
MHSPSGARRIESLTGLRIVAAVLVYLSHVGVPPGVNPRAVTFAAAGYNGVTVFFVLSGFVLAWNYADRFSTLTGRALWSFAVARVARIYPLYLVALLWVVAPALVTHTLPASTWWHVAALQTWSSDMSFALALNGPGWSIGVELFLYACFPALMLAIYRIRSRPSVLLGLAVVATAVVIALAWWFVASGRDALPWADAESAHRWLYRNPLARLGDFVVGISVALLARAVQVKAWIGATAQAVGAVAFLVLMTWPSLLHTAWSWDAAYLLPAALVIWGLAASPETPLARLLSTKPMILAGEASFAFYLLHGPLVARLTLGPVETWLGWLFTTGLLFAMIMFAAVGAHLVIERPAQQWIRRTFDRRRPEAIASPPPVATREPEPEKALV